MKRWSLLVGWLVVVPLPAAVKLQPAGEGAKDSYKLQTVISANPEWPLDGSAEIVLDQQGNGACYAVVFEALRLRVVRREAGGPETQLALTDRHSPIAEAPLRVVVGRDRWRIRVLVNDEVWLTAFDDSLPAGGAAYGSDSPKLTLAEANLQGTESIYFSDDFMRTNETTGEWKPATGRWAMTGVSQADANQKGGPQAERSANPFAFRVDDRPSNGLAVTGQWFWDTYRLEASFRAMGDGQVGLCVYLKDPNNYLTFRWARSGSASQRGAERQLIAVRDGQSDLLAVADGGWAEDQWYRLTIGVVDNHVEVTIDQQLVLQAESPLFGQGQVGLWADGVQYADFDDALVVSTEDVCETFGQRANARWRSDRGEWKDDVDATAPLNKGVLTLADGDGLCVTGSPAWSDYRVAATCQAADGGAFGVVACYKDKDNYLALRWGDSAAPSAWRNALQFVRVKAGQEQLLGRVAVPFRRELWHTLSLETQRGFIRARVADVSVFETFDPEFAGGKAGLLGSGAVAVDQLAVHFLPPPPKLEFTEIFSKDSYMTEWAQPQGSWEIAQAAKRGGVIWHRGEFNGDSEMAVHTKLFAGGPRTVRMVLAGTRPGEQTPAPAAAPAGGPPPGEPGGPPISQEPGGRPGGAAPADASDPDGGGYALVLVQAAADAKKLTADIQLGGHSVRRAVFPIDGAEAVRFQRRGRFLLGYVDDRCVIGYQDTSPTPPNGLHVAISGKGEPVNLDLVEARCENLYDTTFHRAPVEWFQAKGTWETINRWKCDPRWSFFGGYDDMHPLIWSKDDYTGSVQAEAYMGIKMNMPGPPYYSHPSDLCVTVGGDGKDVLSGYAFCFAAYNNTCSVLYRHGKEIARNDSADARFKFTGPQGEGLDKFHRHWFHLVLRKAAGRVTCSVDDKEVFNVADDGTVPGGKVALWTVQNGVMVARVRVWYEKQAARQPFEDIGKRLSTGETPREGADPFANDFEQSVGRFAPDDPRVPVLLQRVSASDGPGMCLSLTSLVTGGSFAVRAVDRPFKPAERPRLHLRAKFPPGARVNAYLLTRGTWHLLPLTGSDRVDTGQRLLGRVAGVQDDDQWHAVDFNLGEAFAQLYGGENVEVQRVVFAMKEPDPYLYAGFNCNRFGAVWYLDDFRIGR